MSAAGVWTVIALVAAGTYALRVSFLSVADRATEVPPAVERVLRMIPPAALSAIVALELGATDGAIALTPRLVAAGVAIAITVWRRSLAPALVAGMVVVVVLEALL